ncbi:wd40 repeat-containing protein : Serine/threonine protein kinase OS=Singulisphaera acidiphila (strain ATCC BAA-1392 / DSM 18658 / VKM B-2454 / MOB10) GN=Sinac_5215 PE=3 SV=1: Pkinase [Gemmataceae bacterium]|nr:wd40 repeat-containing protein : Serine/threonine protein kinase OS=Singulisphaera acidiphila (strain ATCC BAA-1392 / DSM 18658 / VKM B-2454 / MOB10) GN=Sinac_5215 PE=3 SV=1: Pkinase [Gemmataceae bacterium]VTT99611.1 wd40 repeat-containing protein : Serine/threonine protein kinase OS=Singulisphaera acidiphila (strain ATCC BAA-1392 / DSM 18658 / VKM B-2454 / MOB10) GN=Sinac_5215 PE=3 SV=1: Pkinase [Gemmataceae bacterium]
MATHPGLPPDPTTEWPPRSPAEEPGAVRLAAALLRDQAERWREGCPRPVEAYLASYPQLGQNPQVGLALAASEFLIRAGRGEAPQVDDFARRFPQWAGHLADEIAFLRSHATPPRAPGPDGRWQSLAVPVVEVPAGGRSWPRLPGYEVLAELGRGGMAVVYHARQTGLNRPVALKVILAGALAGTADRARMRREAEAVARLRHPNAVQIHDIGEHDGCLYLALEYVGGGTLERRLRDRPLPPDEAAGLVERLASGVQAAHDAGIVHRDLKPANVLLDPDGNPKVTDFGLAKCRDETDRLTATGTAAGTPNYMAPEQVLAEPERVGPATDVYGLGGILYECLTGRPPFAAPTPLETMRRVVDEEVVSVRRLQAGVPRDLETICLKCLHKDPGKRYPSARAVADDLAHFRAGEPICARPVAPAERAWRWVRRHPVVPLLALTLGLMTASVAGLMGWTVYHAYRVAGHLRERELHLLGVRGTLCRLDEAQARYADLAAATGNPTWADRYRGAAAEADGQRAGAARLAPEAADGSGLAAAAGEVSAWEQRAMVLVQGGRPADAWRLLQGDDYRRSRAEYMAAVSRFGDLVDAAADAELRQVRAEGYWSLLSATAVAALLAASAVGGWLVYLRRGRREGTPRADPGGPGTATRAVNSRESEVIVVLEPEPTVVADRGLRDGPST